MKHFCYQCDCERDMIIISKLETFKVKGELVEVMSDVLTCTVCHEEMFEEDLDGKNLERAYVEYRNKHNLLSPAQIKEIRSRFGSGRTVATLLGWSQATLVRYEGGAIPEASHYEQLLRLKNEPDYIKLILKQRGHKLSDRERRKVEAAFEPTSCLEVLDPVAYLDTVFQPFIHGKDNHVEFDFEKLSAIVQFFAIFNQNLFKTKLQKLLFYTDFLCYKRYGYPITGLVYIHHHYGPVPAHHDLLQWALSTTGAIEVKPFEGQFGGEVILALREPDKRLFNEDELEVINNVAGFFVDYSAIRISDFSHGERGYRETNFKEIINYSYAVDLKLD